jgi:hypothetical protein
VNPPAIGDHTYLVGSGKEAAFIGGGGVSIVVSVVADTDEWISVGGGVEAVEDGGSLV